MNIDVSSVVSSPIIIVLLPLAIISIIIWLPSYQRDKRIKKVENALPEMLSELTESLKSGTAIETALKDISETRKDALGDEMKLLLKDMREYSFSESLTRFAKRTNSMTVSRVVSIINLSMTTNAELTDVLRRISEELWSGYMLDVERETKTKSQASMILFGGALLTPLLIGVIFSIFSSAFVKEQFQGIADSVGIFILLLAICATIMYGIVSNRMKQSVMQLPLWMFISYILYTLIINFKLM